MTERRDMTICLCCAEVFEGEPIQNPYCPACLLALQEMFEAGRVISEQFASEQAVPVRPAPMRIETDSGVVSVPRDTIQCIGHHNGRIYVETTSGLIAGKEVTN